MTLMSVFLMNVLCAMVPCEYKNVGPEINALSSTGSEGFRSKRLISSGGGGGGEDYPVVVTGGGRVKGYPMKVMSGRGILAFEGIPYGETPIRFGDPVPARTWSGVRTAFAPGPYCLQIHAGKMFRVIGSEQGCLTLNVYTPKIAKDENQKLLPVIIYIHGGSFAFGSGAEFGPSYILEKDVVLVNMNYRLGVLGFLSTGDEESPGNYGLKDQALAIKWVHENIQAFGGDPNKVTLMGQSAGSVSVHLHMLSNYSQTRNTFHQAVMMSGTAYTHWGLQNGSIARGWTRRLATLVNCPTTPNKVLLQCLRNKDPNWLVAAQMNLFEWIPFPPVLFAPVIEPPSPSAFISERPDAIFEGGGGAKVPAIFSMTKEEGLLANYALNGMMKIGHFINDVRKYLPLYLDYEYLFRNNATRKGEITELVINHYLGSSKVNTRNVGMKEYAKMGTDRMFGVSINKAVKVHAHFSGRPTYASIFSFLGKYNQGLGLGVPRNELGVAHTEDLYYLFNASLYIQGFKQKDQEADLSKIMVNLITNFVSKGEPLYTDKSGRDLEVWDPVTLPVPQDIEFLQVAKDIKMVGDPFSDGRAFWESLGLVDITPFSHNHNETKETRIDAAESTFNDVDNNLIPS